MKTTASQINEVLKRTLTEGANKYDTMVNINKNYVIRLLVLISFLMISISCAHNAEGDNVIIAPPTVDYDSESMTRKSVLLCASYDITIMGVEECGFEINGDRVRVETVNENTFSYLASTEPGREYTVRSYIAIGKDFIYSSKVIFNAPTKSTPVVSDVEYSEGLLKSRIIDDGGDDIVEVGFLISRVDRIDVVKTGDRYYAEVDNGTSFSLSFPFTEFGDYFIMAFVKNNNDSSSLGYLSFASS